jgi:hypothetical protein
MKELILTALAILVTLNLWAASVEHSQKTAELASIERIEAISNGIMNDQISAELEKLNDEQLTEVLGL